MWLSNEKLYVEIRQIQIIGDWEAQRPFQYIVGWIPKKRQETLYVYIWINVFVRYTYMCVFIAFFPLLATKCISIVVTHDNYTYIFPTWQNTIGDWN